MVERLVNDFITILSAQLAAGAGPGSPVSVATGVPAALVGSRARVRIGATGTPAEIVVVDFTTATGWTVVTRAAEDSERFPAATWAAATPVRAVLTAAGVGAVVAATGKTLWVDGVNGNNTTATPGLASAPYSTLAAAKAAAVSGDLIHVRPGAYSIAANLAASGINWHFEAGATVTYSDATPANGLWDDGGSAMTFAVTGAGTFHRVITANTPPIPSFCVKVTHASSVIDIEGQDFTTTDNNGQAARVVFQSAGNLRVRCRTLSAVPLSNLSSGVWWENGETVVEGQLCSGSVYSVVDAAPTGDCHIRFAEIVGNQYAVQEEGDNATAAIWIRANTIRVTGGSGAFSVVALGSNRVYVEAQKLFGGIQPGGTSLFYLRADKIVSEGGGVLLLALGNGQAWIQVNDWDGTDCTSHTMSISAGSNALDIFGGVVRGGASANGVSLEGGTVRFHGTRIDTSANATTGNPVAFGLGGVTAELHDVQLVAGGSRDSIAASFVPQTARVVGVLTANRPVHANVTLSGGMLVRSDTGEVSATRFLVDLFNPLAAAEVSVTGATTATLGRMHVCTGTTSDYTVSLPAASGNAGKLIGLRMSMALTRLVTIDGNSTELIDGQQTRVMWAGESAILLCDGTGWTKIAGKSIPMACVMFRNAAQANVVTATLTKALLNSTAVDNTGRMGDTANNRIVIARPETYLVSGTVCISTADGINPTGANSPRSITQFQANGAGFCNAECSGLTGAYPTPFGVKPRLFAASDNLELFGYHTQGVNGGFFGSSLQETHLSATEVPNW